MKNLQYKCEICGVQFASKNKTPRCCSRACFYKLQDKRVECTCLQCHLVFKVPKSLVKSGGGKFCSKPCMGKHASSIRRYERKSTMERGYVLVWAPHGHTGARRDGRIFEHRLVAESIIGRQLLPGEAVHHRNGIKHDNRPENLQVVQSYVHYGNVCCPHCNNTFLIR